VNVHIICQRPRADRVLPRMARYLADSLSWTVSDAPDPAADVQYMINYIDGWSRYPDCPGKLAGWFTHREMGERARIWDEAAEAMTLRVSQCELYAEGLRTYGPTVVMGSPVERERFTITDRPTGKPVVGLGGFARGDGYRKGRFLLDELLVQGWAERVRFAASGEGWPVETCGYPWVLMPEFYQGLSVYLCTSMAEGGPMGPLEALSCGVPVVIPHGVGMLDELRDMDGIYRYERGDYETLCEALERAIEGEPDREALRAVTELYSVEAWVERHREAFERWF